MRIAYRNVGQAPRMIAIGGLKMSHAAGEAALRTAVDATGVDLTDARADNDRPHVIFALENGSDNPAKLDLPPGASREIDAELTSFTSTGSVRPGDRIAATIPMGRQPVDVTFVARSP
ncbi:hypothetical protein [Sphingomonas solaris]|uniref:Copper chaperone PCu(A)C n=1 Tax=Alterirhizorhabdus solaris TaxID=2529389 RepID=A0A558R514_9SPHN|nr:hypothetical protein [Sphingomonas solaris]TVV74447.1 hypothetical protein FOY91_09710 [Sphingomonas solaris]